MRGLTVRETSLGWRVVRLHYTADPDKDPNTERGKQWYGPARKRMSAARWQKEMEIDYGAMGGRLCFPMFEQDLHVCAPFELDRDEWRWWMACDPHPSRPHAFVWLATNGQRDLLVPYSWFPVEKGTIKHYYAAGIRMIEKDVIGLDGPIRRLMDPAGKGMNADEERTFFDAYREAGIGFHPAKKNREYAGFDLIEDALTPYDAIIGNDKQQRARLRIFDVPENKELIWQLQHLRYQEWKGHVDKDPPEKPEEKRKDLVDCLSYILLDRPHYPLSRGQDTFVPIYPDLNA